MLTVNKNRTTVLATSSIRSEADRRMWLVRTSFLHLIANGEEIRYSLYSSVTSCLEMMHCLTKNLPLSSSRMHCSTNMFLFLLQILNFVRFPGTEEEHGVQ